MAEVHHLQEWVNNEMLRGRYIFTKEDVLGLHLQISDQALQNSLKRLSARGSIMSPWQNFYVIIPTEYKLRGIVGAPNLQAVCQQYGREDDRR